MIFPFWSDRAYLERYLDWKKDQLLIPLVKRLRLHRAGFLSRQRWSLWSIVGFTTVRRLRLFHHLAGRVLETILWRVRKLLTLSDCPLWRALVDDVIGAASLLRFYEGFPDVTLSLLKRLVRLRTKRVLEWLFSLWDPWGYLKWTAQTWAREMRRFLHNYDGAVHWGTLTRSDFAQLAFWLDRPFGLDCRPRRNSDCRICFQDLAGREQIWCPRTRCGYRFHQDCLSALVTETIGRKHIPRCPVCQAVWTRARTWDVVYGGFQPPISSDYLQALESNRASDFYVQ